MTTKTDTTPRRPLVSRETVVPLGIVVAVICVAVSSAWGVSQSLTQNNADSQHRFEKIETRLGDLKQSVESINHDRFTRQEMHMWVELLRARNSDLSIPELR